MDLQSSMGSTSEILKNAFKSLTDEMQMCIQNCTVCHQICLQTITHCLTKGGVHSAPEHIKTMMDCAEICETSANFMVRNSSLHTSTCRSCAEVCLECAESCEQMVDQDEVMKTCADICRRCADSCEKMSLKH